MKKGIVMRVEVYVEGEDTATHDFAQTAHEVVLAVVRSGVQQANGAYVVRVRRLEPVEGGDDDEVDSEDFDPGLDLLADTSPRQPPTEP